MDNGTIKDGQYVQFNCTIQKYFWTHDDICNELYVNTKIDTYFYLTDVFHDISHKIL